jgi:hypothetical protein
VITIWQYAAVRSGAAIHNRLLDSVFSSTLRFLDVTPQGRIIQRFTRDTCVIDGPLTYITSSVRFRFHQIDASIRLLTWTPSSLSILLQVLEMVCPICYLPGLRIDTSVRTPILIPHLFPRYTSLQVITLLVELAAIAFIAPLFTFVGLAVAILGGLLAELYIRAELSTKREVNFSRPAAFSGRQEEDTRKLMMHFHRCRCPSTRGLSSLTSVTLSKVWFRSERMVQRFVGSIIFLHQTS